MMKEYLLSTLVGLAVLVGAVYYQSYYGTKVSCSLHNLNLTGRVVLVTGANTGIGYYTALQLANRGARVLMGVRDPEKGRIARERIAKSSGSHSVAVIGLDLANMKKVNKFVDKVTELYGRVDVLINNAAIGLGPGLKGRQTTPDGLELVMATNHLGPTYLTKLILPILAEDGMVVTVSSEDNLMSDGVRAEDLNSEAEYKPETLYAKTKLLNIMMARSILPQLGAGQSSYTVDPGYTWTDLPSSQVSAAHGWVFWLLGPFLGATSPTNACQTAVWLAGSGAGRELNGAHFHDCQVSSRVDEQADDPELCRLVWENSLKLVQSVLYL